MSSAVPIPRHEFTLQGGWQVPRKATLVICGKSSPYPGLTMAKFPSLTSFCSPQSPSRKVICQSRNRSKRRQICILTYTSSPASQCSCWLYHRWTICTWWEEMPSELINRPAYLVIFFSVTVEMLILLLPRRIVDVIALTARWIWNFGNTPNLGVKILLCITFPSNFLKFDFSQRNTHRKQIYIEDLPNWILNLHVHKNIGNGKYL